MTHQANGTVVTLTTRDLTSKAGKPFTKHGVKLDSGQEFELDGFKQIYSVGDKVSAVGVALKYRVWTSTGALAHGAPEMPRSGGSPAPSAPRTSGSGASESGFPIPAASYQMSIIRQNALTSAVNLVNTALGERISDGEDDPTATTRNQKIISQRADLAIKIAYKFASFSSGYLDTIAAEEMAKEARGLLARGMEKLNPAAKE